MKSKQKAIFEQALALPAEIRAELGEQLIRSTFDDENLRKVADRFDERAKADSRPNVPLKEALKILRKKPT